MSGVPFLIDEKAFRLGFKRWIELDYDISPHVVWCGRTGSGKTVAAKALLSKSILHVHNALQPVELTVIDPKSDTDFSFLDGLPRFYRGEEAPKGLNDFYEMFRRRQMQEDSTRSLKILFVDEFASLVNLIDDKKEKDAAQRKLALLLMLSRSFCCSVQLATQQPSAQTLGNTGNREQFGAVCLLGDSGSETQQMLFDCDSREIVKEFGHIGGRGVGWLSLNGGLAQPVRVGKINNMAKLNDIIYRNLAEAP